MLLVGDESDVRPRNVAIDQEDCARAVVVMNDFVDGATVDVAIGLSQARLAM